MFSEAFKVSRFRAHYKNLYPCTLTKECKNFIEGKLYHTPLMKPVLIVSNNDWMRQSFLAMFMRIGCVDYKVMSAYMLLDIYLGNQEDYSSVLDINTDVLCLYLGYGEFENKRQVDVISQVLNNQVIQGKTVWLFCKSNYSQMDERYPGLVKLFKEMGTVCTDNVGPKKLSEEI